MENSLYNLTTNFEDLLLLNIAFFKGIIQETPYYGIPYTNLIEINEKGFLTYDFQHPLKEIKTKNNKYIETEQKSYICGYIHNTVSEEIKNSLNNEEYYIKISDQKTVLYNNIPYDNEKYNLTRGKEAETKEELNDLSWIETTNELKNIPILFNEFDTLDINNILKTYYHKITIVSKNYNQGGIESELLKILQYTPQIHIPKLFEKKLNTFMDKMLYIIFSSDSALFLDEEIQILIELLFFNICNSIKKLSFRNLILLLKKVRVIYKENKLQDQDIQEDVQEDVQEEDVQEDEGEEELCPICYVNVSDLVTKCCKNRLCKQCYIDLKNKICPFCRSKNILTPRKCLQCNINETDLRTKCCFKPLCKQCYVSMKDKICPFCNTPNPFNINENININRNDDDNRFPIGYDFVEAENQRIGWQNYLERTQTQINEWIEMVEQKGIEYEMNGRIPRNRFLENIITSLRELNSISPPLNPVSRILVINSLKKRWDQDYKRLTQERKRQEREEKKREREEKKESRKRK